MDFNQPFGNAFNNEAAIQYNIVQTEFNNANFAFTCNNKKTAEQAYQKGKFASEQLSRLVSEQEARPYRVMFHFIEVMFRQIKISEYLIREKFKKAFEELALAKTACNAAAKGLSEIDALFRGYDPNLANTASFKAYLSYFDTILSANTPYVQYQIMSGEGVFVDEIEVIRKFVEDLRRINQTEMANDPYRKYEPLINMVNVMADQYETRIELLEEKRENIEYLKPIDKNVFIVHGHDVTILHELQTMLRTFGIEPVILNQMPDYGKTVIEKFEELGRKCAFAFVIVTPDDIVENKQIRYFQGRPNVLFELGWFYGRFGRSKVRILRQEETQMPSDLHGMVNIEFRDSLQEVYENIKRDLEYNRIIEKNH